MRRLLARLPAALLLLFGANTVWAFSTGPPAGRTLARALGTYPAETSCTSCHSGNTLNDPNGGLQILDVPFAAVAGQTYPLRVRLNYALADTTGASNPLWGFELTAVNAADGKGVGTLLAPAPNAGADSLKIVQVTSGTLATSNRQYIEHTFTATRLDQPGPVEWHVDWVAPATATNKVIFFATGNAANGNASTSGDHVFATAESTYVTGPGVPAASPATTVALLLLLATAGAGAVIARRKPA
jgi:hypothetical protein